MGDRSNGRQSARLNSTTASAPTSDDQMRQMILDIKLQNDKLLENQDRMLAHLEQNTQEIAALKIENTALKSKVNALESNLIKIDQYSRKDTAILTGLNFSEGESNAELETKVLNVINSCTNSSYTISDFSAIHRNGRILKPNGRPPTVTIKFLRFNDKDKLFTRSTVIKRKSLYQNLNFHHCLCKGMIDIQNKIVADPNVKFVRYMGANRHFDVCYTKPDGTEFFLNRIQSFEHFQDELNKV